MPDRDWPEVLPAAALPSREALAGALRALEEDAPECAAVTAEMLDLLARARDPFSRSALGPGHFTASALVVSPDRGKLLLIEHRRLGCWLQPGGHIEPGDESLEAAARREVEEETGVSDLVRLGRGIFDVDVHVIPASTREGPHRHFDVRYAFIAANDRLRASAEVGAARWVELAQVAQWNPEPSIARCVARLPAWLSAAARPTESSPV